MTNALDQRVIGTTAYDSQGSKLGKIKELYVDDRTSSPKWISVHTGLFGLSESLVPLAGATAEEDSVRVAVTKDAVSNAPHVGTAERITPDEESELISHYGIRSQPAPTPQTPSTSETPPTSHAADSTPKHDSGTTEFAHHAPVPDGKRVTPPTDATDTRESAVVRSEEQLDVGTRREEYGTARIRKYTTTEQESVTVPVTHEAVRVIREPIDNPSSVKGEPFTDTEREVTLHEDQIVVDKHAVPVERVRLGVEEVTEQKTVQEAVRKEHIDTDGIGTSDEHPKHRK